ncbi:MAG: TIGR03790 family protein [Chlorobiales bacterium]|nr:TIGR03790 family protein [Chlorobiales bacterium]
MKKALLILAILSTYFFNIDAFAQVNYEVAGGWNTDRTYAAPATPEEVLVVYNSALGVSDSVKNYYVSKRGIPANNVIGLNLPNGTSRYGATYNARTGQITGPTSNMSTWQFYRELIETPLMTEIENRQLKDKIRFIVLVRGIPQTLNSSGTYNNQYHYNASVDALLCLLYQDVMRIYGTYYRSQFNPYYSNDYDKTFDSHFKSRHFSNGQFQLTYLVSRLDGGAYPNNYQTIKEAIDRGANPDMRGTTTYILDDKDNNNLYIDLKGAKDSLSAYNFPTKFDNTASYITNDTGKVMGYSSFGIHSGLPKDYIVNRLQFSYANGAVFNSAESFNGWTFNKREDNGQGLLADFLYKGGTGGIANVQEPYAASVARTSIFFGMYAMGYSLVEAAYMSIPYLGWVQVVVGDPLTVIAQGKETVSQSKVWDRDMVVSGNVYVTAGASLTIKAEKQIRFMPGAKLVVENGAHLVTEQGAVLYTTVDGVNINSQIEFVSGVSTQAGTLNFTQIQNGSNVSIRTIVNTKPPKFDCCNKTVSRYYSIETDATSFSAAVVLPYNQSEISNPKTKENKLEAFHYDGAAWKSVGGQVDTVNNVVRLASVTQAGLWAIGDPSQDVSLPVTLKSISANMSNSNVQLSWKTASETDNAGFVLFRNGEEVAGYRYATSLKGQGTTSTETSYSFLDKTTNSGESYTYKIRSIDYSGQIHDYDQSVTVKIPSTEDTKANPADKPIAYELGQNYPNPFNPSTIISYKISKPGVVSLVIYDVLGRRISTLVNEKKEKGAYEARFDATALASGVYLYRLQTGDYVQTKQMVLVR